ncbi:MAG: radical SAM protein [Firmicutes bacterium]|nr:radical SAM protein [Candidatus Fermentithermobacillaceae bacterium]
MPDVLLVTPPRPLRLVREEVGENLGLGFLASVLRKRRISVEILDGSLSGWSIRKMANEVRARDFKVLGVSLVLPSLVKPGFHLIRAVRSSKRARKTPERSFLVAVGGHTPSLAWRETLSACPDIDAVVRGEGELTFLELVEKVLGGEEWRDTSGIAFLRDGIPVSNPPRALITNLDELPPPDHDLLPQALSQGGHATVYSSRGCYGKCSFCSIRAFYDIAPGPKWRAMSPGAVVDEIERLCHDYGAEEFRFSDDNFIGPGRAGRERASEIAREIIRRGLKVRFMVSARADNVDRDLLALLKEAGLTQVFLGVEAGVQSMLDRFNKGVTVEENRRAVSVIRELGIEPVIGFILFDPETTTQELFDNLTFLKSIGLTEGGLNSRLDVLNRLEVYPGTPAEEKLKLEGNLRGDFTDYRYGFRDPVVSLIYHGLRAFQRVAIPVRRAFTSRSRVS